MKITLIGMPGSGKSYIGKKLASKLGYPLVELDLITEERHHKHLPEVLEKIGDTAFLAEQSADAINHTRSNSDLIISPGGSIVYSEVAMNHLQNISKIIYLETSIETIEQRVQAVPRGIVGLGNKTFGELYMERITLYKKWSDYTVNADRDAELVIRNIEELLAINFEQLEHI